MDDAVAEERRRSWILRLLHKDQEQEEQPARPVCEHRRVELVQSTVTGETLAQLCLDCDAQFEPPDEDEPAPGPEQEQPKEPAGKGKRERKAAPRGRRPSAGPARSGPKPATPTPGTPGVRRSRFKPAFFTVSAAATGWAFGLVQLLGVYLPVAEQAATGMVGLLLALAGGYGAWRLFGRPEIARIFPFAVLARVLAAVGAAELCRRMAPAPVAWLNDHGQGAGLGASAVSLLITAGGMCGGLWWLIDRRVRHHPLLVRWLARIPLASALLATGLYTPGINR
ncbi:hypothetical protein [Streptomyces fagopyri]|uniref:hypothetical protein n=1 Tax=Streptomyces fagopyri TaxID=2662397 RepID=UPI003813BB1A